MGVGKSAGKEEGGAAKSFGVFDVVRAKAIPAAPRSRRSPPTLRALAGVNTRVLNNKPSLQGQPPRPETLGPALPTKGGPQRSHHPAQ